ncbi:MAG: SPOR domain-containing protein [Burkholderiaceae bacterium]
MAFFKIRKGGDDQATVVASESIEDIRKRAKHRLLGAAVLVSLGVIGVPLVFDHQPRPIAIDIPIDIPDKNKTKPLAVPLVSVAATPVAAATPAAAPVVTPALAAPTATGPGAETILSASSAKATTVAPAVAAVQAAAVAPKPAERSAQDSKSEENKSATEARFVVQVGAFSDPARANETRMKLEKAGFKTYAQVVQTKDGERTRVRVGPFSDKSEVGKVAEKIKKLDLPVTILTL